VDSYLLHGPYSRGGLIKEGNKKHMQQDLQIFDFNLTIEEIADIENCGISDTDF
jgi:diketogulonate reductase-like aldo/keto reductase